MQIIYSQNKPRSRAAARLLLLAAAVCAFAAIVSLRPQKATGEYVEPKIITQKNVGSFSVSNETLWYRIEYNSDRVGYRKVVFKKTGKGLEVKFYEKWKITPGKSYKRVTIEYNAIHQPGSLLPKEIDYSFFQKEPNMKFTNEKKVFFDWQKRKVTIVPGDNKSKARTVPIPSDVVSDLAANFYILQKKNLVPGKVFRFATFNINMEQFIANEVQIISESRKDVFEVSSTDPNSTARQWVGAISSENPNGITYRIELANARESLSYVNTTKKKACPECK